MANVQVKPFYKVILNLERWVLQHFTKAQVKLSKVKNSSGGTTGVQIGFCKRQESHSSMKALNFNFVVVPSSSKKIFLIRYVGLAEIDFFA